MRLSRHKTKPTGTGIINMTADSAQDGPELRRSLPWVRFSLLLASVMLVSMAYGVTLPVLPFVTERILGAGNGNVMWHTGMLTTLYTFALFFFSPVWGAISDRLDRHAVIITGLTGSGLSLFLLDSATSLPMLYLARGLSGALSAAVLPAALAAIAESSTASQLARRFALTASSTTMGFLMGPVMGSWLSAMVLAPVADMRWFGLLMADSPFFIVAALSITCAALIACLPAVSRNRSTALHADRSLAPSDKSLKLGLLLTGLVVFGITSAEIGITLLGKQNMALGPKEISRFFLICSLVMIGVQLLAFPVLARTVSRRRLLSGGFACAALGLLGIPFAGTPGGAEIFVALASAGTGVLVPALALMISDAAGTQQGKALGWQAAAANLGQALGAGATALLFPLFSAAPFVAAGAMLGIAATGVAMRDLPLFRFAETPQKVD